MKVGDLVYWDPPPTPWEYAEFTYECKQRKSLQKQRSCGIIIDKNNKKFFVLWQNGEFLAHDVLALKVVDEDR